MLLEKQLWLQYDSKRTYLSKTYQCLLSCEMFENPRVNEESYSIVNAGCSGPNQNTIWQFRLVCGSQPFCYCSQYTTTNKTWIKFGLVFACGGRLTHTAGGCLLINGLTSEMVKHFKVQYELKVEVFTWVCALLIGTMHIQTISEALYMLLALEMWIPT